VIPVTDKNICREYFGEEKGGGIMARETLSDVLREQLADAEQPTEIHLQSPPSVSDSDEMACNTGVGGYKPHPMGEFTLPGGNGVGANGNLQGG